MNKLLFQYHPVESTTWVYLSSLLMVGLFFKFGRLWSVRNLDIVLIILLAPGLLLVRNAEQRRIEATKAAVEHAEDNLQGEGSSLSDVALPPDTNVDQPEKNPITRIAISDSGKVAEESIEAEPPPSEEKNESDDEDAESTSYKSDELFGYVWLLLVGCLLLVRLLLDATMVRRPLLEPNLSAGGLTFIGSSLLVFLLGNVMMKPDDSTESRQVEAILFNSVDNADRNGPGFKLLSNAPPRITRFVAASAQLAIVVGMVLIGYWHFSNTLMGIGAATLYLMLPYTALMTDQVDHALPASFLIWAFLLYRYPMSSGVFLGLASLIYYPLFVIPLWTSFYWQRGLWRFLLGVLATLIMTSIIVSILSEDPLGDLQRMFGLWAPKMEGLGGLWNKQIGGWPSSYRLPLLVLVAAVSAGMAIWPAQKNFGTLLSCTAAIMVATQFWHGFGGGIYMAWYLPMLLLTVFRPNLEDRVARSVLKEGWPLLGPTAKAA